MFCFQCEQTAGCKGNAGVCGRRTAPSIATSRWHAAIFNIAPITTPVDDLKAILGNG